MDIDNIYTSVIEKLKKNERVHLAFSDGEIAYLIDSLNTNDHLSLKKSLCLICYLEKPRQGFEKVLLKVLAKDLPPTLQVYAIQASQKHIIDLYQILGKRLHLDFLNTLKRLLIQSDDPNVKLWTMRMIDQCGPQAIMLKSEMIETKKKIGLIKKITNADYRLLDQEIDLLLKKF